MNEAAIVKDQEVYEKCQAAEKEFIQDCKTLVDIDSPTGYGVGLTKVGHIIMDKLKSMNARVEIFPVDKEDEGFHVLGTIYGKGKGSILLLAHMDTVLPVGSAALRPFRIDSTGRAYGPGVSDNKGNIVQVLQAMKILQEIKFENYSKISLLSNCDEENDSLNSRNLIMKLAKEHDYVLCVEGGRVGDGIVVSRAGNGVLEIETEGLAAHAGDPYAGCNAAEELAHFIMCLKQLEDREKATLVTTRIIESGTANRAKSIVPDYAVGLVRIGAFSAEELNRVLKSAQDLVEEPYIPGTKIKAPFRLDFPLFDATEKTMKMATIASAIYTGLGRELLIMKSASGADSCWAATVNEAVLDGVGIVGGGKNHTEQEWADFNTIVPRLYLMTKMLMEFGSNA